MHHLLKRLPSGATAMQTNLMHCVAYGLSPDRLTPYPLNLCSNDGSTHMSISQTQPLDMTLVLLTCPVKLLYGLGHHAAAQSLGNRLIAHAIFM